MKELELKTWYRAIYRTSMQDVSCEVLLSPVVSRSCVTEKLAWRKHVGFG